MLFTGRIFILRCMSERWILVSVLGLRREWLNMIPRVGVLLLRMGRLRRRI
jgi:hypothetical protein